MTVEIRRLRLLAVHEFCAYVYKDLFSTKLQKYIKQDYLLKTNSYTIIGLKL